MVSVFIIYSLSNCVLFFCNDTATPEIDTYLHTLALHDALPICPILSSAKILASSKPHLPDTERRRLRAKPGSRTRIGPDGDVERSEEHTSELQSLMRISYAVFCLKKKTMKYQPTDLMRDYNHIPIK